MSKEVGCESGKCQICNVNSPIFIYEKADGTRYWDQYCENCDVTIGDVCFDTQWDDNIQP